MFASYCLYYTQNFYIAYYEKINLFVLNLFSTSRNIYLISNLVLNKATIEQSPTKLMYIYFTRENTIIYSNRLSIPQNILVQ